jgi:protein SCO1
MHARYLRKEACESFVSTLHGTLAACCAVLLGFAVLLNGLTNGFEHWTFEDLRRERARQGLLAATTLEVRTSQDQRQRLWSKPRNDTINAVDDTVYLVNFIYTACPTVCQALGAEYTQLQALLTARREAAGRPIRLMSLSFDVAHDDPPALHAYAQRHRANSGVWTVAAPATAGDAKRLLQQLGVVVVPDGRGGYVHNGSIHVMNGAGTVLAIFDDGDWAQALSLAVAYRAVQVSR